MCVKSVNDESDKVKKSVTVKKITREIRVDTRRFVAGGYKCLRESRS